MTKRDLALPWSGATEEQRDRLRRAIAAFDERRDRGSAESGCGCGGSPSANAVFRNGLEVHSDREARPATDEEAYEVAVAATVFGQRCLPVHHGPGWTERWYDFNDWCWKCRDCRVEVRVCFTHPNIDSVWNDAVQCAMAAAVAAGLAALLSGGPAAVAAFKSAFYTCLEAKAIGWAKEISVDVSLPVTCTSANCC